MRNEREKILEPKNADFRMGIEGPGLMIEDQASWIKDLMLIVNVCGFGNYDFI